MSVRVRHSPERGIGPLCAWEPTFAIGREAMIDGWDPERENDRKKKGSIMSASLDGRRVVIIGTFGFLGTAESAAVCVAGRA